MDSLINYIGETNLAYLSYFLANNLFVLGLAIGGEDDSLGYAGIGMWRGMGMVFIGIFMHRVKNLSFAFSDPQEFKSILIRNILCGMQSFAIALAMLYIPAPTVQTVVNFGPMCIFVADYFMNGSEIHLRQFVGLITATVGILLTVNIHVLSHLLGIQESHSSNFNYDEATNFVKFLIILFLAIATIIWSIGMVLTKKLKSDSYVITFHLGVLLVLVNGISMITGGVRKDHWSFSQTIWYLIGVGLVLGLSNLFQTIAVKLQKKTGNVTMVGLWAVILGYIISIYRYNEKVNLIGVTGSILIFIGLILVLYK